ncbi:hypothetical protein MPER_06657 [Moniliophthora perniciosa FA553]|nr:hypothetical protein MPER_06657 [Moniliophthora perniciosa FA553]
MSIAWLNLERKTYAGVSGWQINDVSVDFRPAFVTDNDTRVFILLSPQICAGEFTSANELPPGYINFATACNSESGYNGYFCTIDDSGKIDSGPPSRSAPNLTHFGLGPDQNSAPTPRKVRTSAPEFVERVPKPKSRPEKPYERTKQARYTVRTEDELENDDTELGQRLLRQAGWDWLNQKAKIAQKRSERDTTKKEKRAAERKKAKERWESMIGTKLGDDFEVKDYDEVVEYEDDLVVMKGNKSTVIPKPKGGNAPVASSFKRAITDTPSASEDVVMADIPTLLLFRNLSRRTT